MIRRAALILTACVAATLGVAAPAHADDAVEGTRLIQKIATFTPPSVPTKVNIDWGDGTPVQQAGVDLQPDKSGQVVGSHIYAKLGFYAVKTVDANNPDVSDRVSINVKDAPVSAVGATFKVAAAGGGVALATVTDANTLGNPADFKATIDWGDGAITDGTLVLASPGVYTVLGSHAYADPSSHLVGVTVKSTDLGDANVSVQATGDGAGDPPAAAIPGPGGVLDFGAGDSPSIVVEDDGTADIVWSVSAPGRTGDSIVFCRLPRGAAACATKRTFTVDALTGPKIVKDRFGGLHIVISYNGVLQLGGGTLVMNSGDAGQTWTYSFFPVNTGLFQGSVIDATMSLDGRTLYALFGDFVPGDRSLQTLAVMTLDRGLLNKIDSPGFVGGVETYSARSVATLPDGRVMLAGFDPTGLKGATPPRAAVRVVGDVNGNIVTDQPWVPIRGGVVNKLAGSQQGASLMSEQSCDKGVDISPLRGTAVGTARPVGSERSLACNAGFSANDLSYDTAGGRHAVWLSDEDGCEYKRPNQGSQYGSCLIYRYARPGADWTARTTIAKLKLDSAGGLSVGGGKDGVGFITWANLENGSTTIRVAPTDIDSEAQTDPGHRIALTFKSGSECNKKLDNTIGVQVVGPTKGKPSIQSVKWSTTKGLLPRTTSDDKGPFSQKFSVDKKPIRNISSTGSVVFSFTVHASVKYKPGGGGKAQTAKVQQTLSYFCGMPFSQVKKLK